MKRKPTEIRQKEIVDMAMHIIATRGSKKFTAQHIANEVGITAGAIFRHFSSMDEIVDAVVDRIESILFDGFPPIADRPLDRLRVFFLRRIQAVAQNSDISRILLSDLMADVGGEKAKARAKNFKKRSQHFVRRCLREASDHGEISGEIAHEAASVIILGSILGVGHSTTRVSSTSAVETLSRDVWLGIERMLLPTTAS